jgi:hypothetical protein
VKENHLCFSGENNMRKAITFEDRETMETPEQTETNISIFNRIFLWKGVIRRFLLYIVSRGYISKSHLKRQGKCLRCGACCKLVFKRCPYLKKGTDENYSCAKHESFRMPNCIIFPVDPSDIKDRNIISKKPCGYSFGVKHLKGETI